MEAKCITIPPEPVKPETRIILTLTEEEAKDLLRLASWDATIPRAIAQVRTGTYSILISRYLKQLQEALYNAGVRTSGPDGAIPKWRFIT